jgi:hypothetical protein
MSETTSDCYLFGLGSSWFASLLQLHFSHLTNILVVSADWLDQGLVDLEADYQRGAPGRFVFVLILTFLDNFHLL